MKQALDFVASCATLDTAVRAVPFPPPTDVTDAPYPELRGWLFGATPSLLPS